jgi:uncharacterized glyoxalase superfamily protein PhnB
VKINRSMPRNVLIPVLNYPDVRLAVAWLGKAFGFRERLRIGDHRVQLHAAGEGLVVTRGAPPVDGSGHAVMIRVEDIESHHRRSREAGARIVSPPTTYPYGECQYTAVDPCGHVWTFSETIADSDPATWGGILLGDDADVV